MKKTKLRFPFIVFEGCDGAGKSIAISNTSRLLGDMGIDYVTTREPGGTPASEEIREILKHGVGNDVFGEKSTLTGMFTTRFHLHDTLIKPSVDKGDVVLCDRFAGSSYAYQAYGNKNLIPLFDSLMDAGEFIPQFTIFLDVSYEESCNRMDGRGEAMDEIEKRNSGEDKFNNLRNGIKEYLKFYQPHSHAIIDTTNLSEDQVADKIMDIILQ